MVSCRCGCCCCLCYISMGWVYSRTSAWRVGVLCFVGGLALWGTTQSGFDDGERGVESSIEQKSNHGGVGTTSLPTFYMHHILPLMLYPDQEEEYTIPWDVILEDFQTIVTQMMHLRHDDDDDERDVSMECTAIDLRSLTDKYQLLYFQDTDVHQSYCILMTISRRFPWGTVMVRPPLNSSIYHHHYNDSTTTTTTTNPRTPHHSLSIDCPHPLHDRGTGEMSIAIFQGTAAARSLVLAGAHRYALSARHHHQNNNHNNSTTKSPPPPPHQQQQQQSSSSSSCQGPTFAMSDAAHSIQTGFHVAVSAIDQYYYHHYHDSTGTTNKSHPENDDSSSNSYHDYYYTAIQFHGMGDTTCPGIDAYVTHGMANMSSSTTTTTTTTTTRNSSKNRHRPIEEDVLVQMQRLLVEKTTSLRNHTGGKTVILLPQDKNKRTRTKYPSYEDNHDNNIDDEKTEYYSCSMSGGSNLQGRLLNGVPPDQVCTHGATSVTGRFVHIEQKPWLRQEPLYPIWIEILNQIYHPPPPPPT